MQIIRSNHAICTIWNKGADAKWTQQPTGSGRLEKVRTEFKPKPPLAIICRCGNPYPLDNGATALPLAGLAE